MLRQQILVGRTVIKNRLVMAPIATEKSDRGTVTGALLNYYDARTKSGKIGLVVIEHSFVRPDGRASANQLSCASNSDIPGLRRLADTIHQNGSAAIMQISHAGGAAKEGMVPTGSAISPSGLKNPNGSLDTIKVSDSRAMSDDDITGVVRAFLEAALRAKEAGFDGCEIHSAHGFLLNQFYSPLTNKRTDLYSGSCLCGRTKIHTQIIRAIRKAAGDDFIIAMRFGGCDYIKGGSTIDDAAVAAKIFEQAGLDALDISGGMCFFTRPGYSGPGYFGELSEAIRDAVKIPVILAGGVKTFQDANRLLFRGKADMIAVGRAIANDCHWADKNMIGR